MPPSWIFFFALGSSLSVTQFSQQGRQDNLCWVPLSLFKFSRDGSHSCTPGMPQQTWSTVCSVEVWDGWHLQRGTCWMLPAVVALSLLQAAKPSQCDPSSTQRTAQGGQGRVGSSTAATATKGITSAPGRHLSTEVLLELSELHQCTGHYREKCRENQMVKPSSWLRIKARERHHADGQRAEARCHPRHTSQGMHHTVVR